MAIGDRIKKLRQRQDQTLEDIAQQVKISRQTLSRYETGVICNIPSDKVELLAAALHCSPAYLMGWDELPPPQHQEEPLGVGKRLKRCRKEIGLSAEKLAEELGVSATTIYRYENGDIERIPDSLLESLAEALHTTPGYLMGEEEDPQEKPSGNTISLKMTIAERIYKAIQAAELSYGDLARMTGVPKSTLQRYATGETTAIPLDRLETIAKATSVSPAYLMGWEKDPQAAPPENLIPLQLKKVPLLGEIACGEPVFADEHFESYVECDAEIQADFALRCKGDSMINARILDGDIVFIHQQERVENGEVAAVIIDNEATLKRVYMHGAHISLVAENSAYPPIVITPNDNRPVRILGRAILFQSEVR